MNNKHDYTYIRAYGRHMGSNHGWVAMEVERAQAENAPVGAWSRDVDGRWHVVDDIETEHLRNVFKLPPLSPARRAAKMRREAIELREQATQLDNAATTLELEAVATAGKKG